jgi:hypothetical protein
VAIHVPGEKPAEVELEFKRLTRTQLDELLADQAKGSEDSVATVMRIACGWSGVDAAFGEDSLRTMFETYIGAPVAIVDTFIAELTKAKAKN